MGSDLDSLFIFEGFEDSEIFGFGDLKVEGSRVGLHRQFGDELILDPGNLGEIGRNPHALDDFAPDLNWMFLSFSRRFSVSYCPNG